MGRGTAAWAVIVMEAVVMVTPLAGREKGCKREGGGERKGKEVKGEMAESKGREEERKGETGGGEGVSGRMWKV